MVATLLSFVARHWKLASVGAVIALLFAWGGWQHHRATAAIFAKAAIQTRLATLQAAEKQADTEAKAAQAKANVENAREKAALAAQAALATRALEAYRQHARAQRASQQNALQAIYTHQPKAQAWRETPVPASVLAAIAGAGA